MKKRLIAVMLAAALAGCAANEAFREGRALVEAGDEEQGLERIEEAMQADPYDTQMRNYYLRHRAVALQRHLAMGDNARNTGAFERAEEAYRAALRLDPGNARAESGLDALAKERRLAAAVAER